MADPLQGLNVVIVDDNPSVIQSVTDYFESRLTVHGFASGELALENLSQVPQVDVFILDYVLPGINGIQLFQTLRMKYRRSKFVCISGEMSFAMAEKARQLGFDALLIKPFDPTIMEKNIVDLLFR